ncbi:MAG: ATP phosphoribosyltransferase regulatory subunit [Anaerolineae bacterium]|jgi:ATP phosphoribosyltransferase regulatory subunit|nr:ATP phosphoribosyltransferase regulatory subunit [Chloroflexota bacterium]
MTDQLRRLRPHGLDELFDEQAAIKVALEQRLHDTFDKWGYRRILLPTFGYSESLAAGASPELQRQMYRFFDREGNVIALRADMTPLTARLVGTRLYDSPLPLRFCYSGSVFRHEKPQAGQRHEFTQAGVELIGASSPEADAEVIALAVASLHALGVADFQINLGQVAYLRAALADRTSQDALEQAIGRKNDAEIARIVQELGLSAEASRLIRALPHLYGGRDVLATARDLAMNQEARDAVAYLEEVYACLAAQGVAEHVLLDLGEVRAMAYYTGIAFRGYVQGLGLALCSGGRYDDLIGRFGPGMPAVGFALGIERAMLVSSAAVDLAPDALFSGRTTADAWGLIARGRARGLRIEVDVLGRQGDALEAFGRARHARRIVLQQEDGYWLLEDSEGQRRVSLPELQEEMDRWTR